MPSHKLRRSDSDIEKGIDTPSSSKISTYKVVRPSSSNKITRKHNSVHNPAAMESIHKAMKHQQKISAASKIQGKWREYKGRNPKKSTLQKFLRNSVFAFQNTLSKLLKVKGGKKTRKQRRKRKI